MDPCKAGMVEGKSSGGDKNKRFYSQHKLELVVLEREGGEG
jgi:hypothetical protein